MEDMNPGVFDEEPEVGDPIPAVAGYIDAEPVVNLEACDESMEKIAYWTAVMRRDELLAQKRSDRIALWLERRRAMVQKKIDWHQYQVQSYMQVTGTKKLDLPNGRVTTTKGRERVEVTDYSAFHRWAAERGEPDYIPFMLPAPDPKPDKKEILAFIRENDGELPDGVDVVRGEDSIKFKPKELGEEFVQEEWEEEDDGQPTEQQEMEDFAHDDDFHNMSAADIL